MSRWYILGFSLGFLGFSLCPLILSLSITARNLSLSSSPSWSFSGLSPVYPCLSYWEAKNWTCHSMYKLQAEEKDHLHWHTVTTLLHTAPNMISFICHKNLLLAHLQPGIYQDHLHQVLSIGQIQHILLQAVVPPQSRLLHFPLSNMRLLSAHGSMTLLCISHPSQLRTLCPIIQIINEDVEQDWSQYWPPKYTAAFWTPPRPHATGCSHLGQFSMYLTVHLSSSHSINSMRLLQDNVKSLAEV